MDEKKANERREFNDRNGTVSYYEFWLVLEFMRQQIRYAMMTNTKSHFWCEALILLPLARIS